MIPFGRTWRERRDTEAALNRAMLAEYQARASHASAQRKLTDAALTLVPDSLIDPLDAVRGEDGTLWEPIGGIDGALSGAGGMHVLRITSDVQLKTVRDMTRWLDATNQFATAVRENMASYIVGSGVQYAFRVRDGFTAVDKTIVREATRALNDRLDDDDWWGREVEAVERGVVDGEVFIRVFRGPDGVTVRFIEPDKVAQPREGNTVESETFGVRTDADDVETVLAYYVTDEKDWIPAEDVYHIKLNVPRTTKRGMPLLYSSRQRLHAAVRILNAMEKICRIQAAFTLIRKHEASTTQVKGFRDEQADVSVSDSRGRTAHAQVYDGARVVDAPKGVTYDFPAHQVNSKEQVEVVQAQLRAVAARANLPEWMLTSRLDAKYANAFAAESPMVRMFQRLQARYTRVFRAIVDMQVAAMIAAQELPSSIEVEDEETEAKSKMPWAEAVEIVATPPTLEVRDELKDAQRGKLLSDMGVLSTQTLSSRSGLDYDREQRNIDDHRERRGEDFPMPGLNDGDDDDDGDDDA